MRARGNATGRGAMRVFGVAAAATLMGMCGQAFGQPADQKPVLQGPAVDSRQVPGVEPRFGEPMERGRGMRREMAPRAFQEALNALRDDTAPASVRLSAEQESKIDALMAEYREAMRAHVQQRRAEMGDEDQQELRRMVRERRQAGQGGGGAPPAGPGRLEDLRRGMPQFADWQIKIWAELTEPQRAVVEERLAAARERMEERQGQEFIERRMRQRQGADQAPGRPFAGGPPAEGAGATPERLRRLAQRIQQLPPEEQDRILRRLEDELERRSRLREGRPPVDDRPEDAPPPGPRPDRPRGPR